MKAKKKCKDCKKLKEVTKKGYCKKCQHKIYMKAWQKKNKEKQAKYMKKYYKDNAAKLKHNTRVYDSEKTMKDKYNRPVKNQIRDKILEAISNNKIKNILTLESASFLFSKRIPENKVYVFEMDKKEFTKMQRTKPDNVILNYGDIANFKEYDMDVDCIYLDFCSTYSTAKETIFKLKEKVKNTKLFVVTFCTWDETKEPNGDYQFDLLNKIQNLTGINWQVVFGQGYRDKKHSTMVTIILKNPEEKEI